MTFLINQSKNCHLSAFKSKLSHAFIFNGWSTDMTGKILQFVPPKLSVFVEMTGLFHMNIVHANK